MPKIVLKKKSEILAEYKLGKKNVINIGSAKGNDIIIDDKNVSDKHCSITKKDGQYEVKDKNTITGTKINDTSIAECQLQFGDEINLGIYSLLFVDDVKTGEQSDNPVYYFIGIYGQFEGKKYQVRSGETYVGREPVSPKGIENDIVLAGDMTASKGHAKIICHNNKCSIMDIGSTGGVAVNGNKVGQLNEMDIKPGDEIAIGRTIFRFVSEEGSEDYSIPKKHSIFMLKMRQPSYLVVTSIVFLTGFLFFYKGCQGILVNSSVKKVTMELNRYWSPEENVVRMSQQEYDISTSPAAGDINGDGKNEIVYLNSNGQLFAWDGKKGTQLWKPVEIYNSGKTSPAIYDMNNDGIKDIIVLSDTSMLYIIDGQSGGIIRREMLGGAISELSPAIADLNGDGKPDVVVCSDDGMVHFVYSAGFATETEKFSEFVEGPLHASPVIVTSPGHAPKVVIASNSSKIFLFDGANRSKQTIDLLEKTGKTHLIDCTPAVGDINGDGLPEIVVQSNAPQYITAVDINKGEVNWTYFVEPVPPTGLKHTSSPVIVDVNGDKIGDVIVLSANGMVYALKGNTGSKTGELISKIEIPEAKRIISSPAINDFNKDGIDDIVFGGENGNIYLVENSSARKELQIESSIKASNEPITSTPLIADIDGDSRLDIVFTNVLNTVQVLNSNVKSFKNDCVWPMYLGNSSRTGEIINRFEVGPYVRKLFFGIIICIIMFVIKFYFKIKKLNKRPAVKYI